jgi:hypothetical protein
MRGSILNETANILTRKKKIYINYSRLGLFFFANMTKLIRNQKGKKMNNLKKLTLLCGISLSLGGIASAATECEWYVNSQITQAECANATPSANAKGHCSTGGYGTPVCVWHEWYDENGKPALGCWAKCGG